MSEFQYLRDRVRAFAEIRDWDAFHSPKNLTMALGGEVSELLDLFQWLTEARSYELTPEQRQAAAHEIADVQIYLLRLADKLSVDIPSAVEEKMAINEQRYPADLVRGSARKYSAYQGNKDADS
ncbi:nucleotide pyrophosphohydrolase [Aquisalimonas sp.]|uniref:nucleotide pyrophosphohydrolase n=1 Tax=unclassified Aquisalimonas TaxID=2644645 RepID=UPI0025C1B58A|nr:nucleotide pyrophosphohydrolase [Aquisalimonas sp.]